jgi:protoporphyrinogen oxidase
MAQLLKDKYEIEVLEKNSIFGGIARVKEIDGIPYHLVGGHCFNSKKPEVMKFVFEKILPESEWNQIERDAKIYFKEHIIDYPIEFSIKQIANFNADLALNITADFLNASGKEKENLSEWFKAKFGKTLAEEYLIPYNRKIWGLEPNSISSSWVKDKLPQPSKKQFFEALISKQKDNMPHSVFFYPKANSQNTFLSSLANGVNIIYDYQVDKIQKNSDKWIINSENVYDLLINTIPLKELPNLIVN